MRARIASSPNRAQPSLYASTIGAISELPPNWSTPFKIAVRQRSASVLSSILKHRLPNASMSGAGSCVMPQSVQTTPLKPYFSRSRSLMRYSL